MHGTSQKLCCIGKVVDEKSDETCLYLLRISYNQQKKRIQESVCMCAKGFPKLFAPSVPCL